MEINETNFVRPSNMRHTLLCPGSYYMEQGLPDITSPAAEEGTMLHAVMAKGITENILDMDALDAEQSVAIQACWDLLVAECDMIGDVLVKDAEVPLELNRLDGSFLSKGTADVVLRGESLTVIDWKFGREEVPEACENPQLAFYSAAAMQTYGHKECRAVIFQPRIGRLVSFTFTNLEGIINSLASICDRAIVDDGPMALCPSEEACRYCRAKSGCPAFARAFKSLVARPDFSTMQPEQLAKFYEAGQMVKKFIENDLNKAMGDYLDKHGSLAGYEWKEVQGRKEVTDIQGLAEEVYPYCTPGEFRDACTVSLTKLYEKCEPNLIGSCLNHGGKGTKKEAKEKFEELTERYTGRGTPTRRIVKNTNKEQ